MSHTSRTIPPPIGESKLFQKVFLITITTTRTTMLVGLHMKSVDSGGSRRTEVQFEQPVVHPYTYPSGGCTSVEAQATKYISVMNHCFIIQFSARARWVLSPSIRELLRSLRRVRQVLSRSYPTLPEFTFGGSQLRWRGWPVINLGTPRTELLYSRTPTRPSDSAFIRVIIIAVIYEPSLRRSPVPEPDADARALPGPRPETAIVIHVGTPRHLRAKTIAREFVNSRINGV